MKTETVTDIFFDLDHTLWDFDRNSRLAFERVFVSHCLDLKIDLFLKHYEPVNLHYWKLFRENKISQNQLRRGRLSETFNLLNLKFSIEEIDSFSRSYIEELPGNNFLFDGTIEILNYLIPKYRLHIITNGFQKVQLIKMKKSKIEKYFTTITTSDEAGVRKPHPKIFYTAISKAGISPNQSLMIGDSFEADIKGAQKIGMKTLFFNHRNEKIKNSQKFITHLEDIKRYL